MGKLDGEVALVTGGGRGIGRSIALALAREGCSVAISARSATEIEAVAEEIRQIGPRGLAVVANAMHLDQTVELVERVIVELGQLDILVNNAGGVIMPADPLGLLPLSHDDQAFIDNLTLNLVSAQRASRAVLPHMVERRHGRIINIGSGYSKHSGGLISYTAAKHGIVGLTRATAAAVGAHGVTVNCLCPGWTETQLVDWDVMAMMWGTDAEGARKRAAAEALQNRVLQPDELGPMAVLLASPEAHNITGQVISVDSGLFV